MPVNEEEQGQLYLAQALRYSQEVVSNDNGECLDSRIDEAVRVRFDRVVNGLATVLQQHEEWNRMK